MGNVVVVKESFLSVKERRELTSPQLCSADWNAARPWGTKDN